MFCVHCGKEITNDAKFCPKCGKPLHREKQKSAKGKMPVWLSILLIVAAVITALCIGIGVFFLVSHFMPHSSEKPEQIEETEETEEPETVSETEEAETSEEMTRPDEDEPKEQAEPEPAAAMKKEITNTTGMGFPSEDDFTKVLGYLIDWTGMQYAYGIHEIRNLTVQEVLPMTMQYILWSNPYDKYRSKSDYMIHVPVDVVKKNMEDLFGEVYDLSQYKYDPSAVGTNIEGDTVTLGEGDWGEVQPQYKIMDTVYYDDGSFTVTVRYYMYDWTDEEEIGDNYFVVYDCEVARDKPEGFIITDMHTDLTMDYVRPVEEKTNKDYILPDSSIRNLTEQDLRGLSAEELRLARNEIYARHGRKFNNKELQDYFNSKPWYSGTIEPGEWSEKFLNKYETYNVDFISDYEN